MIGRCKSNLYGIPGDCVDENDFHDDGDDNCDDDYDDDDDNDDD